MADNVERIRREIELMSDNHTIADIETYMSNEAMKGGDNSLPWSAYLNAENPDKWLDQFIRGDFI